MGSAGTGLREQTFSAGPSGAKLPNWSDASIDDWGSVSSNSSKSMTTSVSSGRSTGNKNVEGDPGDIDEVDWSPERDCDDDDEP